MSKRTEFKLQDYPNKLCVVRNECVRAIYFRVGAIRNEKTSCLAWHATDLPNCKCDTSWMLQRCFTVASGCREWLAGIQQFVAGKVWVLKCFECSHSSSKNLEITIHWLRFVKPFFLGKPRRGSLEVNFFSHCPRNSHFHDRRSHGQTSERRPRSFRRRHEDIFLDDCVLLWDRF